MAPCGSGILPLLACQTPRWRFHKVPLGIPCGSGGLNSLLLPLSLDIADGAHFFYAGVACQNFANTILAQGAKLA